MTAAEGVAWRLTVEALEGDLLAWSLLRADPGTAGDAVDGGVVQAGSAREVLAQTLPSPGAGRGALWTSHLADPRQEARVAVALGEVLLPTLLREALVEQSAGRGDPLLVVSARGWPARVPWDVLAVDGSPGLRLLETARVAGGLGPAVRPLAGNRPTDGPVVRVVDPGPRADARHLPLYPGGYPAAWDEVAPDDPPLVPDGATFGPEALGDLLRAEPRGRRLLVVGHALAGTTGTPAAAALVLSGPDGVELLTAGSWLARPSTWPVPARVALIACSSDDTAQVEQAGLPAAVVGAGAELLTMTRWTLPTDAAPPEEAATTELALAVDRAHDGDDVLGDLRRWQLGRLALWRSTGRRVFSPVTWGALVTYLPGTTP